MKTDAEAARYEASGYFFDGGVRMKLKKFVLALGVMAACASGALAADAPKKGNTMGGLLVEDTKVANQYVWAPSSGAPMCRTPFTTRFPARGRYVVIGDNQYSAAAGFKILDRGGNAFDAAVGMAAVMGMISLAGMR